MVSTIYKWGFALCAALPLVWLSVDSNGAADRRSYVAGNFGLELDGSFVGLVKTVAGGAIVGEVVQEAGSAVFPKKHIGRIQYEDFQIDVGLSPGKPLMDWIAASLNGQTTRHDGAVVTYDYKLEAQRTTEFTNALLTGITIPACDAASKEPAYLTLQISPERTRQGKAAGKASTPGKADQKQWLPSNFRLDLDGIDTSKVMRIDAFTIKSTSRSSAGTGRAAAKEPTQLEIPNLKVTFSAASADSWSQWHSDMVAAGGGDKLEKSGRLAFSSPNRQQDLLEIKLYGVGIVALRSPKASSSSDTLAKLEAELYCERMELVPKPAQ